jgi:uncharacterized protein (TIGR00369 family)
MAFTTAPRFPSGAWLPASFIRAVRSGKLTGTAHPVTRGRTTQVWEAWIRNQQGELVAQGRVRLLCVDKDRPLG